ncbi:hypothetical protein [Ornithinimicrobium cryptoxanthini]|uniref:hypothetical protein n=1 Tax=Ornithinimicrobium cryptoxanthini TaxID=2934161 RepID=UPI0021172CC7|nr:hypothetical protein [Ornithinimicrobium cryptoxanthini]
MTALAVRPDDLRVAARSLVVAQRDLEELAARLARSDVSTAGGWQGVAALGQRAASGRVRTAVLARCGPLGSLARSLDTLADQGAGAQAVVRAAQRARDEAQAARRRQIDLLTTITEPVEAEAVRDRIMLLDRLIQRAQDEIDEAERGLERGRRVVEDLLQDSWLGQSWDDLSDLVTAGREVAPIWRGGSLVVVATRLLLTTAKAAREVSPFVRQMLDIKVARLLRAVMKPPAIALLAGPLGRLLVPIVVVSDAWPDLVDGGGYTGWRGGMVRVSAGLAIPGSVAMVMPHPVVAGAGGVTVGAYYLVKGGNAIYDNRQQIAKVGRYVWQNRETVKKVAHEMLRPRPGLPWGPLGPLVPTGDGLVPDLPDLPDLGDLRRFVPDIEVPLRLPDVPIGPGLRLPVVPPPSLLTVPIVLPALRKLF